jgi:hypothetical protein
MIIRSVRIVGLVGLSLLVQPATGQTSAPTPPKSKATVAKPSTAVRTHKAKHRSSAGPVGSAGASGGAITVMHGPPGSDDPTTAGQRH